MYREARSGLGALSAELSSREERPFWQVRGMAMLLTVGLSLLMIVFMILLIFGPPEGPLGRDSGSPMLGI